jgi:hypothetical protein
MSTTTIQRSESPKLNAKSLSNSGSSNTTMILNLPEQCFQYLDLPEPDDAADRREQQAIFNTLYTEARQRFKCWDLPYHADGIFRNPIKHYVRRNAKLLSTASGPNPANLTIRQAKMLIEEGLVIPSRYNTKSTTRKHKCVICQALGEEPRSFRRLPGLRKHNMTHLNIKPFQCSCYKRFRSSSALKRHEKAHKCSTENSANAPNKKVK